MKIFIAAEEDKDASAMEVFIKALRSSEVHIKVYLLGDEVKKDWGIVERYDLDGLVKSLPELKTLI